MSGDPQSRRPRPSLRRRALIVASVGYAVLLVLSHTIRSIDSPSPRLEGATAWVDLPAVEGDRRLKRRVRVAYDDEGRSNDAEGTPVVLLHGSPGSKEDFRGMIAELSRRHRVIVPDLPGFGASEPEIPDYSIRAHAGYTLDLLNELGIVDVHVVGFSMGGGVALHLYDMAPHRVRSVTLFSAIGVQELELFGDYRLNHTVHGAQLAAIWLAREGLPHMGLLDGAMLGVPYARNFYDSDQRPLRGILEGLEAPLLILHGESDFLVPPQAAREHHRIVPHSELQMQEWGHFMVFNRAGQMASRIAGFLARVEEGRASGCGEASAARIEAAAAPFDPTSVPPFTGFALILMMALIAVATFVSEDLTCIATGLMVGQGRLGFLPGVIACFVGIYVGDVLVYLAGRFVGRPALERRPLRWFLRPEQIELSAKWFARRGPIVIGLSRFLPGTRLPTYFAAGLLRTSFWSFCFYFFLAVVVWTPLLVGLSRVLGERAFDYFEIFRRHALPAFLVVGLAVLVLVKGVLPLFSFRGRRGIVGRWRRATRWEFWPPWIFYPPVVAYVLWLGLRHRSPLLFTAANPAIEAGGFISESKWEILAGLAPAGDSVAQTCRVPAGPDAEERVETVLAFMHERGLDYPVVLKPDAGQRGSGVAVVRSRAQLQRYLEQAEFDALAQEHAPGREFGVFYYRFPEEPSGRILSITDKRIPFVEGDGRHTIEQLVLRDSRAVCMADRYLEGLAGRLDSVPAKGETIPLVELGTHCRGAIFLDGSWLDSEPLRCSIDAISRGYEGFYFGRYDIRTPDAEDLRQGRNFKIIELNGVTSEATHIYDPKIGILRAWSTLFEQWSIAFEIGRQNRTRGTRPAGPRDLLRLVRDYRRTGRTHPG